MKVLLSADADQARAIGCHTVLKFYPGLSNYVNNPKRLRFADAAVTGPGSDRLIDAAAAHGTADQIVHRRTYRRRRRAASELFALRAEPGPAGPGSGAQSRHAEGRCV